MPLPYFLSSLCHLFSQLSRISYPSKVARRIWPWNVYFDSLLFLGGLYFCHVLVVFFPDPFDLFVRQPLKWYGLATAALAFIALFDNLGSLLLCLVLGADFFDPFDLFARDPGRLGVDDRPCYLFCVFP